MAILVLSLLAVTPAFYSRAQSSSFSNPSVIPGSQASFHGPVVSQIKFPVFTSDAASLGALLSGQTQIMDLQPGDPTQLQTALATTFVNVTQEAGSGFEYILFNMFSAKDPGYYLAFRQAFAHLIDYSYIQTTVLSGISGVATPNIMLPSAFGNFATNNINIYTFSLSAANASLALDPEIAYSATDVRPPTGAGGAGGCDGSTHGVWEYATSVGSGTPNGTAFTPGFITRPDHPTWFTTAQRIWNNAAGIGLCISLRQVVHFSNVFPIIYAGYSDNWGVYDGGSSFTTPLNPINYLYFGFTKTPGWTNPFDNTLHFYNATIEALLHDEFKYSLTNITRAELDSQQAVTLLSQQIPQVNLWWDAVDIPSLNNFQGTYWSGYVDQPAFSSWSVGSNFITSLNVHKVDPNTGKTIVGGTFGVGQHEAPDDFNPYQATSVYDFDILNDLYDTPVIPSPANPTLSGLTPWMVTQMPAVEFPVNLTTPHGYQIVNGMKITFNFYNNITWADNVPFTASDYNFSLWYTNANGASWTGSAGPFGPCSAPCWAKYVNDSSADFTALVPDLTDSVVNSSTVATVYLNASGITDYSSPILFTVFPEHIWAGVNTTAFNADVNPLTTQVNGTNLLVGTGPFWLSQYVASQFTLINRNPGYFRTDIWDWALSGTSGQPVALSVNLTQANPGVGASPIPSTSTVKAWALFNGSPVAGSTTSLTLSGTSWAGSLNTGGWAPGFYEIVVNGTYTDSNGLWHEALQFWGLNLAAGTTTTPTTTTTTTPTTTTTTTPTTTTTTSTNTSSTSISSTSTGGGVNYTLIAGVVIVIIIIAATAAYLVRRR